MYELMHISGERANYFSHILITQKDLRPTDLKELWEVFTKKDTGLSLIILHCIFESC